MDSVLLRFVFRFTELFCAFGIGTFVASIVGFVHQIWVNVRDIGGRWWLDVPHVDHIIILDAYLDVGITTHVQ